jgi:hypothetical protein
MAPLEPLILSLSKMLCRLLAVSQHGVLNVAPLSFDRLAGLLPRLLPTAWRGRSNAVGWAPAKDLQRPSESWMRMFWAKAKVSVPCQHNSKAGCKR